ncbi:uncharacterized protein LOC141812691 [Curcuma longa]|uniref:uncharacterized protein LOC141812691 n=1 Tax=Curcuma longa TaxID=136217 RepID=UPI003D9F1F03
MKRYLVASYTDAIRCRVFSTTLSGSALRWFSRLPPASIDSFEAFKDLFLQHFSTSRTYCKTTTDLFATKQGPKESLKDFVRRFNRVAQDVPDATSPVLVSAFSQGILEGDFFRSLIKKPPVNYDALQSRAVKYIHVEEAQSSRRKETNACPSGPSRDLAGSHRLEKRQPPQLQRRPQVEHHPTPIQPNPRAINAVAGSAGQVAGNRRWLPRFCTFHNTQSHDLSECHQYARKLRQEADQRAPGRSTHRTPQTPPRRTHRETRPPSPRPARPRDRSPRRSAPPLRQPAPISPEIRSQREAPEGNQNNAPLRRINMIVGGATDEDSHRTRKAGGRQLEVCKVSRDKFPESPVISFGPQDVDGVEVPHDDALVIRATVANYDIGRVFVDTGSSVNILFANTFQQMDIVEDSLAPLTTPLYGFTGNEVRPLGQITLPISLGELPLMRTRRVSFIIVDAPSSYNIILGRPTLSAFSAVVSTYHQKMKFPVGDKVGEVRGDQMISRRCYVDMIRTDSRKKQKESGGEVHVIQEAASDKSFEEKEALQVHPDRTETTVQVAAELPPELKEELGACLLRNQDIFAWTPEDITSISPSIAVHRLNVVPGAIPVKQKRRHFGPEQNKAIRVEIQKLLAAGYIKEIQFPTWLSNVVLVPKPGNKWRVCIDFRDLNKACPKDCYPLPRIDQMVDSTAGYEYICMLDAYQGYHQIPLDVNDQDKVSFITADGTFCYTVMPFGLKNAGATYQRLMDQVFHDQKGRNVEVYVDDILIKSTSRETLITDIEETCCTLRHYDLKLNPAKCLFGGRVGRFLGYVVTEKGIEANPDKVQTLSRMTPPRTLRETQCLVGRINALSRFISRAAERGLPFFKVLKKAQRFQWNAECDKAFAELKDYLSQLPRLAKALPGEPLWMYLSATDVAVSSVLVKEEEENQLPIYFFSHLLKDAETRYTNLEKIAWALVRTVRRLRPYFLSHPVTVLTNSNLGKVLTQPEVSGRLIKWTVELGEYDIKYEPRTAVKAQALADFLSEVSREETDEEWRVYVDGASNKQGSGVGVLLISPRGEEVRLAIRLGFKASNNEAEYEAVLAGLQAAKRMGASQVLICSDSQLVSQQIEGKCEVKNDRLRKYVEGFSKLKQEFQVVILQKIPRSENSKADELAKIASSLTEWMDETAAAPIAEVAQINPPLADTPGD